MGREAFFNNSGVPVNTETPLLYPEPGSNRHGLLHWCLRPARLPITPSGLVCFFCSLSPGLKGGVGTKSHDNLQFYQIN